MNFEIKILKFSQIFSKQEEYRMVIEYLAFLNFLPNHKDHLSFELDSCGI